MSSGYYSPYTAATIEKAERMKKGEEYILDLEKKKASIQALVTEAEDKCKHLHPKVDPFVKTRFLKF
ncbi:MAG: hypothetical protein IMW95_12890 [Moorella humiferrea]|nr:hypothetical protein [Moorella humiferrea]